jgi:hypothetical protein
MARQKTAPCILPEAPDNKKRLADSDIPRMVLFVDRPNSASIIAPPRPPARLKSSPQIPWPHNELAEYKTPQGMLFVRSAELNETGMMTGSIAHEYR